MYKLENKLAPLFSKYYIEVEGKLKWLQEV